VRRAEREEADTKTGPRVESLRSGKPLAHLIPLQIQFRIRDSRLPAIVYIPFQTRRILGHSLKREIAFAANGADICVSPR